MKKVEIKEDYITLGQFLKIADLIASGGEAKHFLHSNILLVNEEEENRRGRKLHKGDHIQIAGQTYEIC